MEAVAIVTVLVLAQFFYFGIQAASARGSAGLKAPDMCGEENCDRKFRIHQNTMEQLVVVIPAMWLFAYFVNPLWAAGAGLVYLLGRFVYSAAYTKAPDSRGVGFMMSFLPAAVMLIWVLIKMVMSYV